MLQVDFVIDDVSHCRAKNSRDLQSTTFYRVVLGGNVTFTKAVLDILSAEEDRSEFEWLIQPREKKLRTDFYQQKCGIRKVCMAFARMLLFMFLSLVFLLATVFFYSVHNFLYAHRMQKRKRLFHHIELPMAFAALSGNKDMILLFKDFGVDLAQRDPNLNNVFHYISDMSIDKPDKALKAYRAMVDVIQDRMLLRELIYTKGHNAYGITPFEHMALLGSPVLLTEVSKTVGIIREPVLSISDADVLMQNDKGEGNFLTSPTIMGDIGKLDELGNPPDPRYNLDKFNVSIYESSDMFGKQSKVLNIMATRELTLLSEREIALLYKCPFLNRWWHFKVTQMRTFTSMMQWMDIIYTVVILVLLVGIGGDTRIIPLQTTYFKTTTLVFMDRIMNETPSTMYSFPNDTALNEHARQILPDFSTKFANMEHKRQMWDYANNVGMRVDELTPYFQQVEGYSWLNLSMVEAMYKTLCNGSVGGHLLDRDLCEEEAVDRMVIACDHLDRDTVLNRITLLHGEYYKIFGFKIPLMIYAETTNIMLLIIIGIAALYLLFDLIERWIFLFRKVAHLDQPIRGILLAIISTSFPGSYTKRQLNVLSCSCFVGFFFYAYYKKLFDPDDTLHQVEHHMSMNSYFIISALVFRFLMHIHAMRLLRGIGHFVITTYLMGTNLLHFTTVYAAVLFVFSIIFHFLMREPNCMALKVDQFGTLPESMFTTFQLGMGHGEVDMFSISTPVQVMLFLKH